MAKERKADQKALAPQEEKVGIESPEKDQTKDSKPRAFPVPGDQRWPSKRRQNGW